MTTKSESLHHEITLPEHIKRKIKILTRDFKIKLTDEQISHMCSLKTFIQVDNYAHQIINNS